MSPADIAPAPAVAVGERVAELRAARRMTLDQLAGETGFSKSYLSKIENARKVPPIGSLARIAQALGVDIAEFFRDDAADRGSGQVCLVRASERQPVTRGGSAFGYDYVSLAHKRARKRMEPFVFRYPAEGDHGVYFEHEGEEFLFVLTGRIEFEIGLGGGEWRKLILEPGDSLYFNSATPHKGRGIGGEATALVVIVGVP